MSQKHKDKMKARRIEQLSRTRTHQYVDKSKYKGGRTLTEWYQFRLQLIGEILRELGK